jgi:hypothetical protein
MDKILKQILQKGRRMDSKHAHKKLLEQLSENCQLKP